MTPEPPDFDDRQLCPDGACIGVIGPHGRCNECGAAPDGSQEPVRAAASEADGPFEARELCPDDTCVGLIGPDGRCRECGALSPNETKDPRLRNLSPEPEPEPAQREPNRDGAGDDFDERRLCPDEACIGLIGPNGRCKECGVNCVSR